MKRYMRLKDKIQAFNAKISTILISSIVKIIVLCHGSCSLGYKALYTIAIVTIVQIN